MRLGSQLAGGGKIDMAAFYLNDVRKPRGQFIAVCHAQQRRIVLCSKGEQDFAHCFRRGRIEVSGRFIGQQKRRLVNERSTNGDALTFASGKRRRAMADTVLQADSFQQLLRA